MRFWRACWAPNLKWDHNENQWLKTERARRKSSLNVKKQEKAPQISFSGKSKAVLQQKMGSAQIQGKQKSNLQQQSTSRDTSYRATNSLTQSLQNADEWRCAFTWWWLGHWYHSLRAEVMGKLWRETSRARHRQSSWWEDCCFREGRRGAACLRWKIVVKLFCEVGCQVWICGRHTEGCVERI